MELVRPSYARGGRCNGSGAHSVYRGVNTLQPTPDFPGLWVAAAPMPRASYSCACGHTEHAAGRADVHQLVTRHQDHGTGCSDRASGVPGGTSVAHGGRITPSKSEAARGPNP